MDDWSWEGNVQRAVAEYLAFEGWAIEREADTATRERGIDLLASRDERRLAVEVKGYPTTTYARGARAGQPKRTQPTLQASHWMSRAVFTSIKTKGEDESLEVALALPDVPRYRSLLEQCRWALERLRIGVYLVAQDGSVEIAVVHGSPPARRIAAADSPEDGPRSNRNPAEVQRKLGLLRKPHVAPLTAFVERLRVDRGEDVVPWFDPTEAGVDARILLLLEAPGRRAATKHGSGFVSPDNDDQSAQAMWSILREAGVRGQVVTWNIVPWYVGDGTRIRAVNTSDLDEARSALHTLLSLLPDLRVVVLLGRAAARGWARAAADIPLPTIEAPHPSPQVLNPRPAARNEIRDALVEARRIADLS